MIREILIQIYGYLPANRQAIVWKSLPDQLKARWDSYLNRMDYLLNSAVLIGGILKNENHCEIEYLLFIKKD
jgi:hypothetical protein